MDANVETSNSGVSADLDVGPVSAYRAVQVEDGSLVTSQATALELTNVGGVSHEKTTEIGLFSSSQAETKQVNFAGIFSSEEQTNQTSGLDGFTASREVDTSCCGLNASSSEETYCCTSDALCGYSCSMNWCGEDCSLSCDTVCCFQPIINLCNDVSCPSIACSDLPGLDACGDCITPAFNACSGLISSIDCGQVGECLSAAWPIVSDCLSTVIEILGDR